MMIGLAIDRKNSVHLVDYVHRNGNRYTVCGRCFRGSELLNDFQMNGAISGVCRKCHDAYEEGHARDIKESVRTVFGITLEKNLKRYLEIVNGHMATEHKYWFLAYRDYEKFNLLVYKLNRDPFQRKYGNGRKHK